MASALATAAERIETTLDAAVTGLARATLRLAAQAHRRVELGLLEALLTGVVSLLRRVSAALQRQHTGHLHRNLLWATIALVVIVGLALAVTQL
ncbi:MAG: hypothetical protein V1772_04115 [Chloroflexota bacterium]